MIPRVRIRQLAIVLALVGSASCSEDSQVESRNGGEAASPIAHRGEDRSNVHRSILLITVDTLRPDHLGIYGYSRNTSPEIDRWFEHALVAERAYSTEARTPQSVASILSGRLPQDHGVRYYSQWVPANTPLVPDLLPDGYQTAAFISNPVLSAKSFGIAERFDHYDEELPDIQIPGKDARERTSTPLTDAVIRWLDEKREPGKPLFLWVHYMDPHSPYIPPQSHRASFDHERPTMIPRSKLTFSSLQWNANDGDVEINGEALIDDYDGEVHFTDAGIGRLLAAYAERESIDDSLVILSADHGEAMIEHEQYFAHGYQVHEPIIRVPLLVRGPGITASRQVGLASTVDIVPTILAFAGASIPPELEGRDLGSANPLPRGRAIFSETTAGPNQWRAVIEEDRKWTVRIPRKQGEVAEQRFYDLNADTGELNPRAWEGETVSSKRLLELIRSDADREASATRIQARIKRSAKSKVPSNVAPRATEEEIETLRALGYIVD